MNIERLTKIAEWLENGALHEHIKFDITNGFVFRLVPGSDVKPTCATSCCLAGAAVQFFNDPAKLIAKAIELNWSRNFIGSDKQEIAWIVINGEARELLDLDILQADALFEPWFRGNQSFLGHNESEDFNDAALAAKTIRNFIATGGIS